jgi:hypothetical protein
MLRCVKAKKTIKYSKATKKPAESNEAALAYDPESEPMLRTQIYLTRPEYEFLQTEAGRRAEPMSAVIRSYIDEKMVVPDDAWTNNPMLEPTIHDPEWKGHKDGGINLDHYLYGCPKDWIKVKGKWVKAPALPEDYYENLASREAYNLKIREMDESR